LNSRRVHLTRGESAAFSHRAANRRAMKRHGFVWSLAASVSGLGIPYWNGSAAKLEANRIFRKFLWNTGWNSAFRLQSMSRWGGEGGGDFVKICDVTQTRVSDVIYLCIVWILNCLTLVNNKVFLNFYLGSPDFVYCCHNTEL